MLKMAGKRKHSRNNLITTNENDTASNTTKASTMEETETETGLINKITKSCKRGKKSRDGDPHVSPCVNNYAINVLCHMVRERSNTLKLSDIMVTTKPQKLVNYACVSNLITNNFFRSNKFMDNGWEQWSTVNKTLCSRVCSVIAYSEQIKTEEDKRRYWSEDWVPMVNKRMSCLKGKMTQKLRKVCMGK